MNERPPEVWFEWSGPIGTHGHFVVRFESGVDWRKPAKLNLERLCPDMMIGIAPTIATGLRVEAEREVPFHMRVAAIPTNSFIDIGESDANDDPAFKAEVSVLQGHERDLADQVGRLVGDA